MPSAIYTAVGVLYAFVGLTGILADPPQQTCPSANEISPCACNVKKNGLDILCESTDISHINQAMIKLKARSPIIFYLKLRHNNLPKLQGFVFLALDIRHLTIHNSSLAVIEESALSSLGMLNTKKMPSISNCTSSHADCPTLNRKRTHSTGRFAKSAAKHPIECDQEPASSADFESKP